MFNEEGFLSADMIYMSQGLKYKLVTLVGKQKTMILDRSG